MAIKHIKLDFLANYVEGGGTIFRSVVSTLRAFQRRIGHLQNSESRMYGWSHIRLLVYKIYIIYYVIYHVYEIYRSLGECRREAPALTYRHVNLYT